MSKAMIAVSRSVRVILGPVVLHPSDPLHQGEATVAAASTPTSEKVLDKVKGIVFDVSTRS